MAIKVVCPHCRRTNWPSEELEGCNAPCSFCERPIWMAKAGSVLPVASPVGTPRGNVPTFPAETQPQPKGPIPEPYATLVFFACCGLCTFLASAVFAGIGSVIYFALLLPAVMAIVANVGALAAYVVLRPRFRAVAFIGCIATAMSSIVLYHAWQFAIEKAMGSPIATNKSFFEYIQGKAERGYHLGRHGRPYVGLDWYCLCFAEFQINLGIGAFAGVAASRVGKPSMPFPRTNSSLGGPRIARRKYDDDT